MERIHMEVHRNLIGSMPRGIRAVIKAKGWKKLASTTTGSLTGGHCKSCIKSTSETNVLVFGTNKDMILFLVDRNSHEFSFVLWATIDLARKFLPNVNQFFESLYVLWNIQSDWKGWQK